MSVGMPGTGLGGVFYIALAAFMPLRELTLTGRGESGRLRIVLTQAFLSLAVVAALGMEAWGMKKGPAWLASHPSAAGGNGGTILASEAVVPALAAAPIVLILAIARAAQKRRELAMSYGSGVKRTQST